MVSPQDVQRNLCPENYVDIVRRHVDFRAENLFAVVVFSRAHFPEKTQVFSILTDIIERVSYDFHLR